MCFAGPYRGAAAAGRRRRGAALARRLSYTAGSQEPVGRGEHRVGAVADAVVVPAPAVCSAIW